MENRKRLWIFNPDCEMAIANGSKYYMPPANVVTMAEDLAVLPVFLGESEDWVLVRNLPDPVFMASVYEPLHLKAGFIQEAEAGILGEVKGEPWGWSPKMCHWLAERGMGEEWKTERKEWYSRRKAREGLIRLFGLIPDLEKEVIPETGYSIEEIEQKMKTGKYLVKAPWSSSGKGILVLGKPIAVKEKERLHGILKRQGYVMLEKKLNKVLDFAMEFCAGRQGVEFIGWSVFSTGLNGEYRGNYLGAQAYIEQLLGSKLGEEKLQSLKQELPENESRQHTEHISVESAKKDMESVLALLPQEREFITDDGLMGTLTLRLDTVQVEPSGYGSSTKEITTKRSYPNLAEQDTQYLPKTITENGKTLTLSDIQWQTDNTANLDGYAVADRYTAVATYSGSATSNYVKGYTVTADYTGTVSRIALNRVRYVAIFEGTPIQPTEPAETPATASTFRWSYVLIPIGIVAAAGAGVGGALLVKHRKENADEEDTE